MRLTWRLTLLLLLSFADAHAAGIRLYLFDGDEGHAPLAAAKVYLNGQLYGVTNADGRIAIEAKEGSYEVRVATAARNARFEKIPVIQGELTELVATVYLESDPNIALEHRAVAEVESERAEERAGPKGTVVGRCVDDGGKALRGVQIFVQGRPETASTNAQGQFVLQLPVGQHALSAIRAGHRTGRLSAIEVSDNTSTTVDDIVMPKANRSLDDFVVSAPYIEGGIAALTSERRETSNVVDVIGAEQMAKSGDSDAAGALKRVTGLTIVGSKYIYVRGMGERYSSTTLNGMFIPSPEPERRVVPLDMFPTGILSSVVVQKTFSSNQSGEFGGGVVQLRTRRLPETNFFEASVSSGGRLGSVFGRGLSYEIGDYDWLGFDSGAREFPENVRTSTERTGLKLCSISRSENCLTPDELVALGRSFPPFYDTRTRLIPPDLGLSVSGGYVEEKGATRWGGVSSFQYDQSWSKDRRIANTFRISAGALERSDGGEVERLVRTIQMSGILELGLDLGEAHQLSTTTLLLRNTDDEASQFLGTNIDERSDVRVRRLRWVERELLTQQVRGRHEFNDLRLTWHYGLSLADRLEPNRRISQYDRSLGSDDPYTLSAKPEGNRRFYSDLDETTHELASAVRYTLTSPDREEAASFVEGGLSGLRREREVETRRYKFQGPSGQPAPLDDLFARENIGNEPEQYRLLNTTQLTDDYSANQQITSTYALSEMGLFSSLRVVTGLRYEVAQQEVRTFSPFSSGDAVKARLSNQDLLPSASLTWVITEGAQLRTGYGRTVSRPEFRELSPARFDDVTNRRSVVGNPDLDRATIDHYDARWEWYFSPKESVSLAGFYKRFTQPIETKVSCGADKTITYRNSPSATNLGAEVAVRKDFDFLRLPETYVEANLSIIDSSVDLGDSDGCETSSTRPLQGQSPYIANLKLGYDSEASGLSITGLYNVFGERIVEVGTSSLPDVYEQPRHLVDLVFGWRFTAGLSLKLKAKNVLDPVVERTAGGLTQSSYRAGRSISVGLKYAP